MAGKQSKESKGPYSPALRRAIRMETSHMIRATLRKLAVTSALLLAATAAASISARADIINGGFESASLAGWQSVGDANVVTASFGTGPAGGTYQAVIEGGINSASTAALAAFLGISAGSLNALGNGITHGGSAIAQTFVLLRTGCTGRWE